MAIVDTVIFDLGGVLVNLDWDSVCDRLQEHSSLEADAVRREVVNGPIVRSAMAGLISSRGYHQALCEKLVANLSYDDFVDIWNSLLNANEAIVPIVERLKLNHRLVLGSNTDAIHFTSTMERFPVLEIFERYFLSYEMGLLKPDPAFFHHVLQRLDTSASNCVFIDDRAENVEAAQSVGMIGLEFTISEKLQADLDAVL